MARHLLKSMTTLIAHQGRITYPVAHVTCRKSILLWNTSIQRSASASANASNELKGSVKQEVEHHDKLANQWWNVNGQLKALHSLNGLRVPFIRDGLVARGKISPDLIQKPNVLNGQQILEVGCGGGILTEQLGRLGASVTGIDLGEDLIRVAREHLSTQANPKLCDLIQYKVESVETHSKDKTNFYDAVVISEVLEHIDDKIGFLTASIQCLKPGGSVFITTLNKTAGMWITGVLFGEYIARMIPVGTHHYDKMISPLDVQRILDTMGCHTVLVNGCIYEFWNNTWRWINSSYFTYALQAVKTEI